MKPTQEQTECVKIWLNACLSALFRGDPFPPRPATIEEDLRRGVDFSDIISAIWIYCGRRDLLDHVIALNERHLERLLSEYVRYCHEDRTHLGLGKETPNCRAHSKAVGRVLSQERLGGLHHRYDRAA